MSRHPLRIVVLGAAGALAAVAALAALFARINHGPGFEGCTMAFGWTVPLVGGLTIGAVAWLLLLTRPSSDGQRPAPAPDRCPECGERVFTGWRLCPGCGHLLDARGEAGARTPLAEGHPSTPAGGNG